MSIEKKSLKLSGQQQLNGQQLIRESGERRQMGGQLLVVRSMKPSPFEVPQNQVLLIKDEPKHKEAVAGVSAWRERRGEAFGFPGGGRGITNKGQEETLLQNLDQEALEELGVRIRMLQVGVQLEQLAYPMLVAQQKAPASKTIDVFAVAGAVIPYDILADDERELLETSRGDKPVVWKNILELAGLFQLIKKDQEWGGLNEDIFRPQVLGASYIYMLSELGYSLEAIAQEIHSYNVQVFNWVLSEAQVASKEINNGAFVDSGPKAGQILAVKDLAPDEYAYLFGEKRDGKRYTH